MNRRPKRQVWLAECAYLCTPDARYDVHNDYDVQKLEVDWGRATLHLTLQRATGPWVEPRQPACLRLSLRPIRDLLITGNTEDDLRRKDIDLIAYASWSAPLANRDVWIEDDPDADTLVIEFGDASYLRVRADCWVLDVEQR